MRLTSFVYQGSILKFGLSCGARKMQFSGATLRSLANFYVELERFCCPLSAAFPVYVTACLTINYTLMVNSHFTIRNAANLKVFGSRRVVIFVSALAYLDMCSLSYRAYKGGGR